MQLLQSDPIQLDEKKKRLSDLSLCRAHLSLNISTLSMSLQSSRSIIFDPRVLYCLSLAKLGVLIIHKWWYFIVCSNDCSHSLFNTIYSNIPLPSIPPAISPLEVPPPCNSLSITSTSFSWCGRICSSSTCYPRDSAVGGPMDYPIMTLFVHREKPLSMSVNLLVKRSARAPPSHLPSVREIN